MTNPLPFRDKLRESLLYAAEQRQLRRKRKQKTLGFAAAVVLLTTGVLAGMELRPEPTVADVLSISRTGNMLNVTLLDLKANPRQVEKELRAAGLDATVKAIPASPSQEGTFSSVSFDASVSPLSFTAKGNRLIIDASLRVRLAIGRKAAPNEPYDVSGSAFAKLEPLHCSGLRGHSPAELQPFAEDHGFSIRWRRITGTQLDESDVNATPDFTVAEAYHTAPQELLVLVKKPQDLALMGSDSAQDCE